MTSFLTFSSRRERPRCFERNAGSPGSSTTPSDARCAMCCGIPDSRHRSIGEDSGTVTVSLVPSRSKEIDKVILASFLCSTFSLLRFWWMLPKRFSASGSVITVPSFSSGMNELRIEIIGTSSCPFGGENRNALSLMSCEWIFSSSLMIASLCGAISLLSSLRWEKSWALWTIPYQRLKSKSSVKIFLRSSALLKASGKYRV